MLAFEGDGVVQTYADRLQAERAVLSSPRPAETPSRTAPPPAPPVKAPSGKRLSYKEKQELESLPDAIDALETELAEVEAVLADPRTYKERADEVAALTARAAALPAEIDALMNRWEALAERS